MRGISSIIIFLLNVNINQQAGEKCKTKGSGFCCDTGSDCTSMPYCYGECSVLQASCTPANCQSTPVCTTAFSTNSYASPTLAYDGATTNVGSGFSSFFTNNDPSNCVLASCQLKSTGCSTTYSPTNFQLSNTDPYQITANTNVATTTGWTETFCFECTYVLNSVTTQLQQDNFSITQSGTCSSSLQAASSVLADQTVTYDASVTTMVNQGSGYSSFFQTTDATNCPIDSCTLYDSDCSTAYSGGTNLQMGGSSPWQISAKRNVPAGFSIKICMKCSTSSLDSPAITKVWTYTQSPIDCSAALTANNYADQTISYLNSATKTNAGAGYTSFFSHVEPYLSNCPVQSCQIYEPGCATVETTTKLTLAGSSPYQLTASQNVIAGYFRTICFKCTFNGGSNSITQDNWKVTQSPLSCSSALSPATTVLGNQQVAYDSSTTTKVDVDQTVDSINGYQNFFQTSDSTNCPISTCTLYDVDGSNACTTTPFSGDTSKLSMDSTTPWKIKALKNVVAGFQFTICISCSAPDTTPSTTSITKVWTYQQLAIDCSTALTTKSFASKTVPYQNTATQLSYTYTDYYNHPDTTNCPLTSCELRSANCISTYSQTTISFSSNTISAPQNVIAGYTEGPFCFRCTFDGGATTIDTANWQFTQSPLDCTGQLSAATTVLADQQVNFDSAVTTLVDISAGYSSFFQTSDSTNCPISACTLYDVDGSNACTSTPFSGDTSKMTMDSTTPWKIKAVKNILAGFKYTVCIECKTPDTAQTTKIQKVWTFEQLKVDCTSALTTKSYASQTISYSSSTTPLNIGTGYLSFYNHPNPSQCPLSSCQWLPAAASGSTCGTGTFTPTQSVSLGGSSPYQLTAPQNIIAGYTETFCFRCTFDGGATSIDTNSWSITQSPLSCSSSIQPATTVLADFTTAYDSSTTSKVDVGVGYGSFFKTTNSADCPINSCTLYDVDGSNACTSTPFSGDTSKLSMDASSPWQIKGLRNDPNGFTYTVCISCSAPDTNPKTTITKVWTYTQSALDCATVMTDNSYAHQNLIYDASVTSHLVGSGYTSFFTHAEKTHCPVTSCELRTAGGCASPYSPTFISLGTSDPWLITAPRNKFNGYSETFCFRCTYNGGATTISNDNWKITQVSAGCNSIVLTPDQSPYQYIYNSSTSVDFVSVATWFQLSPVIPFCIINKYYFSTASSCATEDTFVQLSMLNDNLQIDKTKQTTGLLSAYLCAQTPTGNKNYRKVEFEICGMEVISLVETKISYEFQKSDTAGVTKDISKADYINNFQSNRVNCGLEKYELYKKQSDGTYVVSTSTQVTMKANGDIQVNIDTMSNETLYIKGSSAFGVIPAYLELDIKILGQTKLATLLNSAPYFESDPKGETFTLEVDQANRFEYSLPTVKDDNGDTFQLKFVKLPDTITYDEATNTLIFEGITEPGEIIIKVSIEDANGKTSKEYSITFTIEQGQPKAPVAPAINITVPVQQQQKVEIKRRPPTNFPNFTVPEELENFVLTAKIDSISNLGVMVIKFNADMFTVFNHSWINQTSTPMQILINDERDFEVGFDKSTLNFTWNVTDFSENLLTIKLNFVSAPSISPGVESDSLRINLTDLAFFFRTEKNIQLDEKYYVLTSKVRKQLQDNDFNKGFVGSSETAASSTMVFVGVNLVMGLLLNGVLQYLIMFLNSLQMIIHLPMLQIIVPANVSGFFSLILPVLTFDILDEDYLGLVFEFDEPTQEQLTASILDQMEDLGYESHNSILNLGSLAALSVVYWIRLLFYSTILQIMIRMGKMKKTYKNLKKVLFYNELFYLSTSAYIEFVISGYLNVKEPLETASGETISVYIGYYSVAITCFIMPGAFIWVLSQTMETIRTKKFIDKWGALYTGINLRSKSNLMFYPIFCARRLIFCTVAFFLMKYPYFQAQIVFLCNILITIFQGGVKPLDTRLRNRIEIMNETFITIVCFHLLTFTDWIPDMENRLLCGWSMIFFIVLSFVINVLIVIWILKNGCGLLYTKYKRILKHKFGKKKEQKYEQKNEEIQQLITNDLQSSKVEVKMTARRNKVPSKVKPQSMDPAIDDQIKKVKRDKPISFADVQQFVQDKKEKKKSHMPSNVTFGNAPADKSMEEVSPRSISKYDSKLASKHRIGYLKHMMEKQKILRDKLQRLQEIKKMKMLQKAGNNEIKELNSYRQQDKDKPLDFTEILQKHQSKQNKKLSKIGSSKFINN